ncbi:winged helix-turn-helix transcriptional regulator [Aestuariibaculum sediminum]|uniref:Helix-turn-helix transcriptional regulator n=1 Tax=Aestuariibaculum sediminum TaxID=2770637 RepID=A0A8J6Q6U9_9FLAO|nr:helix-turn-helix domain-containing protein [Aestuariibaculum sediminum]MBD0832113.1 helix-turn-helix transcriptional regulator [Aestuariibaculum sediminum]
MENKISKPACEHKIRAIHDVMYLIGGKWKISIIACLCYGNKRYSDILNEVEGISGKMLSRELKELEMNKMIERTILNTKPVGVEYSLTELGNSLKSVIDILADWGIAYREERKILEEQVELS